MKKGEVTMFPFTVFCPFSGHTPSPLFCPSPRPRGLAVIETLPLNVLCLFTSGTIFLGFCLGVVRLLAPGPGLPFVAVVLLVALAFLRPPDFAFLLDPSIFGGAGEWFLGREAD
jgi:hypothetical protein